MKVVTPATMRRMDQQSIGDYGIPGMLLMEHAAMHVAQKAAEMAGEARRPVLLCAGPGNNGGDALAVARMLSQMRYPVRVISTSALSLYQGDASFQVQLLSRLGIPVFVLEETTAESVLEQLFEGSVLTVDGIFGTGLNRAPEGRSARLIASINRCSAQVLSIDIPSGVDGRSGGIPGACVRADATVTLACLKTGLLQYPGAAMVGAVQVVDIGIPHAVQAEHDDGIQLLTDAMIAAVLPERSADAHKGTTGTVLALAGSKTMSGAAVFCCASVLRSGAGLVRAAIPEALLPVLGALVPEAVLRPLPDPSTLAGDALVDCARALLNGCDVLLAGPGLGTRADTAGFLRALLVESSVPVVLDADALNLLAGDVTLWEDVPSGTILTPHPGEMSRLLGQPVSELQQDRLGAARQLAEQRDVVVVLKGAGTVIAAPDGRTCINPTGNNGMATAGSGDVLAGIVAGLLAQGAKPLEAAAAGAYLHGRAGDLAVVERGTRSLVASDLIEFLPKAFLTLEK